MNLTDLLKQHQDMLNNAKVTITARELKADDIKRIPEVTQQRITAVTARIDDLGKQKTAAMQRYDAAITEHQVELKRLQGAVTRDEALTNAMQRPQESITKEAQQVAEKLIKAKPADQPPKSTGTTPTKSDRPSG
jgi:hypothetical protein